MDVWIPLPFALVIAVAAFVGGFALARGPSEWRTVFRDLRASWKHLRRGWRD
jgi:hypothetical protein